jgi:hypothetical protein
MRMKFSLKARKEKPLGSYINRWEGNFKMTFKEIEYQGRDWNKLAQHRGPVTRMCKYGTDPSGSINVWEFTLCFWRATLSLGVSYKFPDGPPSRLYVHRGPGFRPRVGSKIYVTITKACGRSRTWDSQARRPASTLDRQDGAKSQCRRHCLASVGRQTVHSAHWKWEKGDMTHSWRAESLAEALIGLRLTVLFTADSNEPFNRFRRPFVDAWRWNKRRLCSLRKWWKQTNIFKWNTRGAGEACSGSLACVYVQQVLYIFMSVAHGI